MRREQIIEFLGRDHPWYPSVREIADGIGLALGPTHRHLQRLYAEGRVKRVPVSAAREAYTLP